MYRDSSSGAWAAGGTNVVVNKPAGTVDGDVLVVAFDIFNNAAYTMTPPAGWVQAPSGFLRQAAKSQAMYVFVKVAAGEPASWNFTASNTAVYGTYTVDALSGRASDVSVRTGADLSATNGSAVVTSASAAFTAADVGKGIQIAGTWYTIQSVTNVTTAVLTANYAGATAAGIAWALSFLIDSILYDLTSQLTYTSNLITTTKDGCDIVGVFAVDGTADRRPFTADTLLPATGRQTGYLAAQFLMQFLEDYPQPAKGAISIQASYASAPAQGSYAYILAVPPPLSTHVGPLNGKLAIVADIVAEWVVPLRSRLPHRVGARRLQTLGPRGRVG
jgi:hypothetical protein